MFDLVAEEDLSAQFFDMNYYIFVYLTNMANIIKTTNFVHHCDKVANRCYIILSSWTKV